MDSILTSIKLELGIAEECEDFDRQLIMFINTVFPILYQIGATNKYGFFIEDKVATWDDLLGDDKNNEGIKSYVYAKVKIMFDPPSNSTLMEALKSIIDELEFRTPISANDIKEEVDDDAAFF